MRFTSISINQHDPHHQCNHIIEEHGTTSLIV
jgi:hypothetical protein